MQQQGSNLLNKSVLIHLITLNPQDRAIARKHR
jgi:hypothetical protein